jgi:hypothetical protein
MSPEFRPEFRISPEFRFDGGTVWTIALPAQSLDLPMEWVG